MRITPTKVLNLITAAVLVILLWTIFKQTHNSQKPDYKHTCDMPEEYQEGLHKMAYAVHHVLDSLNLVHFLCYGSLFGQVRQASTLPWEKDAEFCVLNEEFSNYDEVFLKRQFRKKGLEFVYDSAEGQYVISAPEDGPPTEDLAADAAADEDAGPDEYRPVTLPRGFKGVVQLVVFAKDKEIVVATETMYHRVGWKRRLLPPDCEYSSSLDCFPARLAETPLPLKLFGSRTVPVPREEFEILKYHFPNNWWREEKPLNC